MKVYIIYYLTQGVLCYTQNCFLRQLHVDASSALGTDCTKSDVNSVEKRRAGSTTICWLNS